MPGKPHILEELSGIPEIGQMERDIRLVIKAQVDMMEGLIRQAVAENPQIELGQSSRLLAEKFVTEALFKIGSEILYYNQRS